MKQENGGLWTSELQALFDELWDASKLVSGEAEQRACDACAALIAEPWSIELLYDSTPVDVVDNMSTLGNEAAILLQAVKHAVKEKWYAR
jgi:hypothetical protein